MSESGRDNAGSSERQITVYLLDDHELVRRGIREVLEGAEDIRVVGESGAATGAVEEIVRLRPDVALLDGRLPDGSGIDVCRRVREADPGIQALILTSYDQEEPLFAAIKAGAAGYLLKQVKGGDLVDAVRRVAAGQSIMDPALTASVLDRLRHGGSDEPNGHLTEKEEQILELVGEGLTNRQIAARLGLAEKTVKNYVSTMLGKLGVESRTQAAIVALKRAPH
ncbi:response regulator [Nocardioides sp.]|uniref:response regulator n=1 Tax=Nocardioides sp. TaxID=35761 RepID=UPI0037839A4B